MQAVWIVALVLSILCAAWTGLQIRYYARRDSHWSYLFVVWLSWWLGVVGVAVLLPLDLALISTQVPHNATLSALWHAVYWTTFVLSWVVCGILMEFHAAGEFTFKERLRRALRANLVFYVVSAGVLLLLGIVLVFTRGFGPSQLSGFLLAASNFYGMVLIVVMIGYGLVELPRQIWVHSQRTLELQAIYFAAPLTETDRSDAEAALADTVRQLGTFCSAAAAARHVDERIPGYIDVVVAKVPRAMREVLDQATRQTPARPTSSSLFSLSHITDAGAGAHNMDVTVDRLAALHARLKRQVVKFERTADSWDILLERAAARKEDLLNAPDLTNSIGYTATGPSALVGDKQLLKGYDPWRACFSSSNSNGNNHCGFSLPSCRTVSANAAALAASAMSLVLLWCECTAPFQGRLSVYGALLHGASTPLAAQFVTLVALGYVAACAYSALFKFKLLDGLALHGRQHTDVYCLLYNASYLGRLQFALGINFFSMLHARNTTNSEFGELVGKMDVVPFLGTSFNKYIPVIIIAIAALTWFRVADRLMTSVGLEVHQEPEDTPEHRERLEEGTTLVERALMDRSARGAGFGVGGNAGRTASGSTGAGRFEGLGSGPQVPRPSSVWRSAGRLWPFRSSSSHTHSPIETARYEHLNGGHEPGVELA